MATDPQTAKTVSSLLNYDVLSDDDNELFREIDINIDNARTNKDGSNGTKRKADAFGGPQRENNSHNKENRDQVGKDSLGLDEEVQINKKRKPTVKLDEERLLSEPGIPKLRALLPKPSKTTMAREVRRPLGVKLGLKGKKGYEFADAAKLLGFYQLWLDNLFPRANFADGLQLVEKVGRGKRMQMLRKEWIQESRRESQDFDQGKDGDGMGQGHSSVKNDAMQAASGISGRSEEMGRISQGKGDGDDDPLVGNEDADLSTDLFFAGPTSNNEIIGVDNGEPDEDELDALMAESSRNDPPHASDAVFRDDRGSTHDDLENGSGGNGDDHHVINRNQGSGNREIRERAENDGLDALHRESGDKHRVEVPAMGGSSMQPQTSEATSIVFQTEKDDAEQSVPATTPQTKDPESQQMDNTSVGERVEQERDELEALLAEKGL